MAGTKHGTGRVGKKRPSAPGTWKYVAGRRPFTVAGYERKDRRLDIWIRYGEHRQRLTDPIRDDSGRIDPQLEARAIALIGRAQEALKVGRLAPGKDLTEPKEPDGPVTLRQAFDAALSVGEHGIYAVQSQQWADMRTLADDICAILKGDKEVESFRSQSARALWRGIATKVAAQERRVIQNRGSTRTIPWGGHRMAVRAVDLLFRTLRHYYSERRMPPPRPPEKWMEKMDVEWVQIVGSTPVVANPRHSAGEVAKMLSGLKDADPRLALLLELAAETRLGQARRCTRKDLDLAPGKGVLGHGELEIRGLGKKRGTVIDLTEEQRKLIDRTLKKGYLSAFEDWYQMGRIKDYPLFPKGRFRDGVATVRQLTPVTRDGLRGWFQNYESKLGIPHVTGRGWYGVRRQAADLAENTVSDARALNLLTGHSDERMRRAYQDRDNPEVRRLAVTARHSIRKSVQPHQKAPAKKRKGDLVGRRKRN